MRKTCFLITLSIGISTLAFAESFAGKLLDEACYAKQQSATGCEATSNTKSFAIDVSGKVYKLDPAGNQKASTALKNRAEKAADPTKPPSKEIMAKVDGTEAGGTITAQSVEVE
jgi:hypothetical protein